MSKNVPGTSTSTSTELQPKRGTKILPNGAVYDLDVHRIVANPGGGTGAIANREQAVAMTERRESLKHAAIARAANIAARQELQNSRNADVRALVDSDMAYMQAIAIGRTQAAMDADSPYGNAAAQWIAEHTGNNEPKQTSDNTINVNIIRIVAHDDNEQAIDADIVPDDGV
jgi:hypothetical protein